MINEQETPTKPLEPRQKRFCDEYLLDMNATAAAIRAGYKPKSAHCMGSRILALPQAREHIKQAQQKFVNELDVFSHTLMHELKQLLQANTDELLDFQGNLKKANEVPRHLRGVLQMQTRETFVKGEVVTVTTRKLVDRMNVLMKLCKQMGWLNNKARSSDSYYEPNYANIGDGVIEEI